jgi:hypothetical protein
MRMPQNPRKFWTVVGSSIAGLALIAVLVGTLINFLNAPEDKVSLAADIRVASSLYERNLQAIRLAEITNRASDSVELKSVAKQWSVTLKDQNKTLAAWLKSNRASLFTAGPRQKSYSMDNSQLRWLVVSQYPQSPRLAQTFLELTRRIDSVVVEDEAVNGAIREVFKKIIDLDTKTMAIISKLANQ